MTCLAAVHPGSCKPISNARPSPQLPRGYIPKRSLLNIARLATCTKVGRPSGLRVAAAAADVIEVPPAVNVEPDTAASTEAEDDKFVWTKNWYPVIVTENLDPKKPNPFKLLGKDFVLWADSKGEWHCFEDRCPHRLVPLHEGWVNGDTLECAYHGWKFQGDGACTLIPSIAEGPTHDKACSSKKACVASFPVQNRMGLTWVWPESGPVAWIESAASDPVNVPDLEDETIVPLEGRWYQRDMPHDWEFFIENVVDPAHVAYAHHGVAGINRTKAGPVGVTPLEPLHPTKGFKNITGQVNDPSFGKSFHEFRPPCLVKLTIGTADGGEQFLILYATPTERGWMRHIGCTFLKGSKNARLLSFFTSGLPAWLLHYFSSDFLHGDLTLLYGANRTFVQEGSNWQKSYYTPTQGDIGVANFWNWMNTHAGGQVPYPEGKDTMPPPMTREQMLDRYNQHTKNCVHCKKALSITGRLQSAARIAAFALLGLSVLSAWSAATVAAAINAATTTAVPAVVSAVASVNPTALLVAAGVFAIGVGLLEKFKTGFYYIDFNRPE